MGPGDMWAVKQSVQAPSFGVFIWVLTPIHGTLFEALGSLSLIFSLSDDLGQCIYTITVLKTLRSDLLQNQNFSVSGR